MTALGNPKLYCSVYALCPVHCVEDFCEGCILFLLHLHLVFCFHLTGYLFCQKGPSSSCRTCTFLPLVQKSLCVVPYCLNADNLAIWLLKIFYSSVPEMVKQLLHPGVSLHLWTLKAQPTELHTHVCSCLTVMWQLYCITFSHFQNIRNCLILRTINQRVIVGLLFNMPNSSNNSWHAYLSKYRLIKSSNSLKISALLSVNPKCLIQSMMEKGRRMREGNPAGHGREKTKWRIQNPLEDKLYPE